MTESWECNIHQWINPLMHSKLTVLLGGDTSLKEVHHQAVTLEGVSLDLSLNVLSAS